MIEAKYSAGLMSQSFWFIEFKKIVKLINDGKSIDEIKALCLEENLLGIPKAYRAKRIYGYIIGRVKTLDSSLIELFCESDLATQKLINLITILRTDRLFFEFVYEVYREKVILGIPYMEDSDLGIFFKNKEAQSDDVAAWIETTVRKLKNTYINYQDLQGIGMTQKLALPTLVAIASIALGKPTISSLAILGEISIAGTMLKVDELANALQVCLDSGARKVLLPITSAGDLGGVPSDLIGSFNIIFYSSPEDAVFKALGVE